MKHKSRMMGGLELDLQNYCSKGKECSRCSTSDLITGLRIQPRSYLKDQDSPPRSISTLAFCLVDDCWISVGSSTSLDI
ncbi:hypothetical protein Scep_002978 [Stephania cephalantha]|uniref:Uncharacterized protein n=1 Tax=Stephania cephalantha TaxID=152367 RepID=A0AAP0LAW8_9MAGN